MTIYTPIYERERVRFVAKGIRRGFGYLIDLLIKNIYLREAKKNPFN